ncbi:hypothetical protein, partial [Streptomyces sp. MS191]|uniref:hypothetical protein n=1 Tax=Streptomyces sp. ms191 TaxID=1827978 RepID=UPI001C9BE833
EVRDVPGAELGDGQQRHGVVVPQLGGVPAAGRALQESQLLRGERPSARLVVDAAAQPDVGQRRGCIPARVRRRRTRVR